MGSGFDLPAVDMYIVVAVLKINRGWGCLAAKVRLQHFPEDPGLGPGYRVSKSSCGFGMHGYARSIPSILDLGEPQIPARLLCR